MGQVSAQAAWVRCYGCEDYLCTIHLLHAHECPCPPAEEWETDPYAPQAKKRHIPEAEEEREWIVDPTTDSGRFSEKEKQIKKRATKPTQKRKGKKSK